MIQLFVKGTFLAAEIIFLSDFFYLAGAGFVLMVHLGVPRKNVN